MKPDIAETARPNQAGRYDFIASRSPTPTKWVKNSSVPSLEKIRQAIGTEFYENWLKEQLDRVILKDEALYCHFVNGEPAPF
jgi:hypothetical protein